ncbi:MAG: proline racemase family protein [Phycisphaerales bacterium]
MRLDRVHVVDSHTEGEPTRVVVSGGPDLGGSWGTSGSGTRGASVADQLRAFREQFDWFRSAVVNEPRGSDPLVGALLCPPASPGAVCGVIFFNTSGFLHACGHGTMGVARTLAHLGRLAPGFHRFETPAGDVGVTLGTPASGSGAAPGPISIDNVPSFRAASGVSIELDAPTAGALGVPRRVAGDIAWGGNWFFLIDDHPLELDLANVERLTAFCRAVRRALAREGVVGQRPGRREEIDHIELTGPAQRPGCDRRNFVLCPGGGGSVYDRSPCGTGTSAKLACLIARGALREGQTWRQESIIGTAFAATARVLRGTDVPPGAASPSGDPTILPTITGHAWITGEGALVIDPADPFRFGIPHSAERTPS